MEILDSGEACFVVGDDLLDFTLDGEAEEDYDLKTSYSSSSLTAAFGDDSLSSSFPVSLIHYICLLVLESTRTSRLMTLSCRLFSACFIFVCLATELEITNLPLVGCGEAAGLFLRNLKLIIRTWEKKKYFLNLTCNNGLKSLFLCFIFWFHNWSILFVHDVIEL